MWQEIIVAGCVLAAAYVVLRQWLPLGGKKNSGCGGCGSSSDSKCNTPSNCSTPERDKNK